MSLLLTLGVTACSGGNHTGAIPQQIQPGATVIVEENNEAIAEKDEAIAEKNAQIQALQQKQTELEATIADLQTQLANAQSQKASDTQTINSLQAQIQNLSASKLETDKALLDLKAQIATNEEEKQRIAAEQQKLAEEEAARKQAEEEARKQAEAEEEARKQAEEALQKAKEEAERLLQEKATNYQLGKTSVSLSELTDAIENGTTLQNQATAENKNINTLIGVRANIPAGTILSTTSNEYGGYAIIRESIAETSNASPVNQFVAIAKTATTDKSAVIDATYKGSAAYTTGNMPTIFEKFNTGEPQYELTLNVKNDSVSGGVVNTLESIVNKRAEQEDDPNLITFKETTIQVIDDMVGFKGDAQFNYGWGFLNNIKETGDKTGTYQGVFTGTNAEGVVGTFSTNNTSPQNSVQGAFVGKRQ